MQSVGDFQAPNRCASVPSVFEPTFAEQAKYLCLSVQSVGENLAQRFLAEGVVYRPEVGKCRDGTDVG